MRRRCRPGRCASPRSSARPASRRVRCRSARSQGPARDYTAPLPAGLCAGCRLLGLLGRAGWSPGPSRSTLTMPYAGRADRGSAALPAGFDAAGRWRVASRTPSAGRRSRGRHQLHRPGRRRRRVRRLARTSCRPSWPARRPPTTPRRRLPLPGLAEQPHAFHVAANSATLPRAGDHGILFDLDYAVRAAERTSSLADNDTLRYEVWAAPGAPGRPRHAPGRRRGAGAAHRERSPAIWTSSAGGRPPSASGSTCWPVPPRCCSPSGWS